ncbi:MAG: DNA adenine methylase [Sedimentisphaerales bacterium]
MESDRGTHRARPFLKWAGGKTQLLDEIDTRLPNKEIESGQIDTYIEPFIGGGAVFFYIAQKYPKIKHFYLFDINTDLINCYNEVRNSAASVIADLRKLERRYLKGDESQRRDMYYRVREEFNSNRLPAKLIFLNKTCFNGLYRVNKNNAFNVPFGNYKNPTICDEENLMAVSTILQDAEIIAADFEESEQYISKHCFAYLDPPYRPISATARFTSYAKNDFTEKDQIRLSNFCGRIRQKGARFLLSNSDPNNEDPKDNFFDRHYRGFTIATVKATRMINCIGSLRGQINELIITNYRAGGQSR